MKRLVALLVALCLALPFTVSVAEAQTPASHSQVGKADPSFDIVKNEGWYAWGQMDHCYPPGHLWILSVSYGYITQNVRNPRPSIRKFLNDTGHYDARIYRTGKSGKNLVWDMEETYLNEEWPEDYDIAVVFQQCTKLNGDECCGCECKAPPRGPPGKID